jgi:hypothetical protein
MLRSIFHCPHATFEGDLAARGVYRGAVTACPWPEKLSAHVVRTIGTRPGRRLRDRLARKRVAIRTILSNGLITATYASGMFARAIRCRATSHHGQHQPGWRLGAAR